MTNRVSWAVVRETLSKYLADELAEDMITEMEARDLEEARNEVGMTYGEWKDRFGDDRSLVWAADSFGGFGKAGWPVCGNADDLRIVQIVCDGSHKVLHLWHDGWGDWRKAPTTYMVKVGGEMVIRGTFDNVDAAVAAAREKGLKVFDVFRFDCADLNGDHFALAKKVE